MKAPYVIPETPSMAVLVAGWGDHHRLETATGRTLATVDYERMRDAVLLMRARPELADLEITPAQHDRLLTLFDTSQTGPLTDADLRDIQTTIEPFLSSPEAAGTMAHLVVRLVTALLHARHTK